MVLFSKIYLKLKNLTKQLFNKNCVLKNLNNNQKKMNLQQIPKGVSVFKDNKIQGFNSMHTYSLHNLPTSQYIQSQPIHFSTKNNINHSKDVRLKKKKRLSLVSQSCSKTLSFKDKSLSKLSHLSHLSHHKSFSLSKESLVLNKNKSLTKIDIPITETKNSKKVELNQQKKTKKSQIKKIGQDKHYVNQDQLHWRCKQRVDHNQIDNNINKMNKTDFKINSDYNSAFDDYGLKQISNGNGNVNGNEKNMKKQKHKNKQKQKSKPSLLWHHSDKQKPNQIVFDKMYVAADFWHKSSLENDALITRQNQQNDWLNSKVLDIHAPYNIQKFDRLSTEVTENSRRLPHVISQPKIVKNNLFKIPSPLYHYPSQSVHNYMHPVRPQLSCSILPERMMVKQHQLSNKQGAVHQQQTIINGPSINNKVIRIGSYHTKQQQLNRFPSTQTRRCNSERANDIIVVGSSYLGAKQRFYEKDTQSKALNMTKYYFNGTQVTSTEPFKQKTPSNQWLDIGRDKYSTSEYYPYHRTQARSSHWSHPQAQLNRPKWSVKESSESHYNQTHTDTSGNENQNSPRNEALELQLQPLLTPQPSSSQSLNYSHPQNRYSDRNSQPEPLYRKINNDFHKNGHIQQPIQIEQKQALLNHDDLDSNHQYPISPKSSPGQMQQFQRAQQIKSDSFYKKISCPKPIPTNFSAAKQSQFTIDKQISSQNQHCSHLQSVVQSNYATAEQETYAFIESYTYPYDVNQYYQGGLDKNQMVQSRFDQIVHQIQNSQHDKGTFSHHHQKGQQSKVLENLKFIEKEKQ